MDKAIDRLLQKHMHTVKGRTVRNPKLSSARYSLGTSVVVDALKKTFDVYDARFMQQQQQLTAVKPQAALPNQQTI